MMKSTQFLLWLFLLTVAAEAQSQQREFKIVGYYPLRSALESARGVPLDKLTHINLWFLNPDSTGNFGQDLSGLRKFVEKAHKKKVKVLFSIGGGSRQKQYHTLLQPRHRDKLVSDLTALTLKWNVDGIDVDLEGSDIDERYEDFVVELAQSLRAHNKLITAAIAVYYKDQLSDRALSQYDFVNVMSYDRTGPWRPEKPGPHATYEHAVEDLAYFGKVRNIPREKMTLGVPFYGYGYGPELTSPAISMNFREIVNTFPGSECEDQWTRPDGKIVYYNGLPTIRRKTALAMANAGGIMIWQLRGDARGKKSLLHAINKAARQLPASVSPAFSDE